jgi:hypothetical protein
MAQTTTYLLWDKRSLHCNDIDNRLFCNEHVIPLTPTEYRLCRMLLNTQTPQISLLTIPFIFPYVRRSELQTYLGIPNKQLLRKYVSNTNAKLAPYGLHIKPFEQGYVLIDSAMFSQHNSYEKQQ